MNAAPIGNIRGPCWRLLGAWRRFAHTAQCAALIAPYGRLISGYHRHKTADGDGVSIEDIDGLHRLIGSRLVALRRPLTGLEFRFLRIEMDLSQRALALRLGKTDQAIAKWEKEDRVPQMADLLVRALYMDYAGGDTTITALIDQINELDRAAQESEIRLEETEQGWREAV